MVRALVMSETLLGDFWIMLSITMKLKSLSDGCPIILWASLESLAAAIYFLVNLKNNLDGLYKYYALCFIGINVW